MKFVAAIVVVAAACRYDFTPNPGATSDGSAASGDARGPDGGLPGDALAAGANLAFVSSGTYQPGALGGTAAADALCNSLAAAAGLPGTYVAWLSSSTQNAIDRVASARGWVRTDGLPIADQPSALGTQLWYTVGLDERGARPAASNYFTVTGTDATGHLASGGTCTDFTVVDITSTATGVADATDASFTNTAQIPCGTAAHIYCFAIDHATAVAPTPAPGRLAFVSAGTWLPGSGFSSADGVCQNEATAAGLPGTYLAMLASKTASAQSRFSLTGAPWVRVDGLRIASTPAALFAGNLDAPITITAAGTTLAASLAWTGYGNSTDLGTSIGSFTCNDWGLASGGAAGGRGSTARASPDVWTNQPTAACNTAQHLFCLQQ